MSLELPDSHLAVTCYLASQYAAQETQPDWHGLPLPVQQKWLLAAQKMPEWMEKNDGAPWRQAAEVLAGMLLEQKDLFHLLPELYKLSFEAACRHLATILASDEPIEDLQALEQSWMNWAFMRLQQKVATPSEVTTHDEAA